MRANRPACGPDRCGPGCVLGAGRSSSTQTGPGAETGEQRQERAPHPLCAPVPGARPQTRGGSRLIHWTPPPRSASPPSGAAPCGARTCLPPHLPGLMGGTAALWDAAGTPSSRQHPLHPVALAGCGCGTARCTHCPPQAGLCTPACPTRRPQMRLPLTSICCSSGAPCGEWSACPAPNGALRGGSEGPSGAGGRGVRGGPGQGAEHSPPCAGGVGGEGPSRAGLDS